MLIPFCLLLILISAVVAVELKDLLAGSIALGISGFFVGIAFLLMMAPDLSLVQFLVEIITTATLIIAIAKTRRWAAEPEGRKSTLALVAILISAFALYSTVVGFMTPFGGVQYAPGRSVFYEKVAGRYISEGLEETGSRNIVTAIILDYRAYDTLGEIVVLFVSILGISTIMRRIGPGG